MTTTYEFKKITPQESAAAFTLLAARVVMLIVVIANVPPYKRLVSDFFFTLFGVRFWQWATIVIGGVLQAGVQAGEIRPLLINRKSPEQYRRITGVATICYVTDVALALYNWPPIKVSLAQFWLTKNFSDLAWLNIGMIIATVYGPELLVRFTHTIERDL